MNHKGRNASILGLTFVTGLEFVTNKLLMILNWNTFTWVLEDKIFTKVIELLSNRLNATHLNDSKKMVKCHQVLNRKHSVP